MGVGAHHGSTALPPSPEPLHFPQAPSPCTALNPEPPPRRECALAASTQTASLGTYPAVLWLTSLKPDTTKAPMDPTAATPPDTPARMPVIVLRPDTCGGRRGGVCVCVEEAGRLAG